MAGPKRNAPETEWEIGLAALVGIGLIGGIGITVANARRRREVFATEHAAHEDATLAQQAMAARWPAAALAPQSAEPKRAFAMPAGPVPAGDAREALIAGDAREALIAEMVAGQPNAENPFRTRKARRRRARTILVQRDLDLRNQATQPFDWRAYRRTLENVRPDLTLAAASA